jgi:hypothetical protein
MTNQSAPRATLNPTPNPTVTHRSAAEFLQLTLPPKEPIIRGICYRRDLIALGGRRRHGKTNFCLNLGIGLTEPWLDFLGYEINEGPFRVLAVLLEDDATEVQDKLRQVLNGASPNDRFALMTRNDFMDAKVGISITNRAFQEAVHRACEQHKPDLIILDNLSQMVGADYNNSILIHQLIQFVYGLAAEFNAAVLMPAHPRKRSGDSNALHVTLKDDPEGFFENIMGSSHFVNSCGSLWGLERDFSNDRTTFLGGAQRLTGQQSISTLEVGEDHRLRIVPDYEENLRQALNTTQRRQAWDLLPSGPFTYNEATEAVKGAMKSTSTFHGWWKNSLVRFGLVVPTDQGKWIKAGSGTGQQAASSYVM